MIIPILDPKTKKVARYVDERLRTKLISKHTKILHASKWLLYFDGSASLKNGVAGGGYVISRYEDNTLPEPKQSVSRVIGHIEHHEPIERAYPLPFKKTGNEAEYMGLIEGLRDAHRHFIRRIEVRGDSLLVVNQINGLWKARSPKMLRLRNEARLLLHLFEEWSITHIPREENENADHLARQATEMALDWTISKPDEDAEPEEPQSQARQEHDQRMLASIRYWAVTGRTTNAYAVNRIWPSISKGQIWHVMEGTYHRALIEEDLYQPYDSYSGFKHFLDPD